MSRILIVGVGGIGGTVAGELVRHRAGSVLGYTRNAEVLAAVREHGYRLTGVGGEHTVPAEIVDEIPAQMQFDTIFLATQPPQMVEAARSVVAHLAEDGTLVCFQNGLPEHHLAPVVGEHRLVGGIVGWGASMPTPGVFERTSAGGFTLGGEGNVAGVSGLLEPIGPVKLTPNLLGARWSKLAVNCAISTLGTLGGDTLGALIQYAFVRRLALEIFSEVVAVTNAEGIVLEKLAGMLDLNWLALTESERSASVGNATLLAKHAVMLAVGGRYRRLRSSMLRALERGRPPAVDFLNGEVVAIGEIHGIPTPVNAAAQALVHRIHRKEAESSLSTLERLYKELRG